MQKTTFEEIEEKAALPLAKYIIKEPTNISQFHGWLFLSRWTCNEPNYCKRFGDCCYIPFSLYTRINIEEYGMFYPGDIVYFHSIEGYER